MGKKYSEMGYTMLNSAPTGSVGGFGKGKWTYDTCKEDAKKYHSRSEFKKCSSRAYKTTLKNKWLDEFFPRTSPIRR